MLLTTPQIQATPTSCYFIIIYHSKSNRNSWHISQFRRQHMKAHILTHTHKHNCLNIANMTFKQAVSTAHHITVCIGFTVRQIAQLSQRACTCAHIEICLHIGVVVAITITKAYHSFTLAMAEIVCIALTIFIKYYTLAQR